MTVLPFSLTLRVWFSPMAITRAGSRVTPCGGSARQGLPGTFSSAISSFSSSSMASGEGRSEAPASERVDKPGARTVRHRVHRESAAEKIGLEILRVDNAVAYHLAAVGRDLDYHADNGDKYLTAFHSLVRNTVIPEREKDIVYPRVGDYIVILRGRCRGAAPARTRLLYMRHIPIFPGRLSL